MTDGGELDEMLDTILQAAGSGLHMFQDPLTRWRLDDMRQAVRKIHDAGFQTGWNQCSDTFKIGARITKVRE